MRKTVDAVKGQADCVVKEARKVAKHASDVVSTPVAGVPAGVWFAGFAVLGVVFAAVVKGLFFRR